MSEEITRSRIQSIVNSGDITSAVKIERIIAFINNQLQTAKEENEKLRNYTESVENGNIILQQQNKQMREALEKIVNNRDLSKICINCEDYDGCHACCNKDLQNYLYNDGTKTCYDFIYRRNLKDKAIAQQALNQAKEGK